MKQETRRLLVRILLGSALGLLVGIIWIPYVIHSRESSFLAVLACVGLGAMAGLASPLRTAAVRCCSILWAILYAPLPFLPCLW